MQNSQSSQGVVARTKRLVLREMTPEDLDDLYAVYQSWGVVEGVVPLSQDREEEYEKLCSYIEWMYGFYGMGLWAVCLKDNGQMIGRCGAWPSEIMDSWLAELGYIIHKAWCGQGYGLESMEAVAEYIRDETEFCEMAAQIHKNNIPSIQLARRLGMEIDPAGFQEKTQMCLYRMAICRDKHGR